LFDLDCPYIDECVYPCPIEPQKLVDALDWMDKDMLALATPKLIGPKPNAFTFSHWLAETILSEEQKNLPSISIVRVSIIGAAWKEPYPGWVEKSNGPSELFVAAGRGYLRSMKGDSQDLLDIVPVDIPVNLLIAASWEKYSEEKKENLTIYHCTSSGLNPFHWQDMSNYLTEYSKRIPYEHAFRRPNLSVTSHSLIHDSYVFFSHIIPAYLADIGLRLIGRKARVVNIYKNLHRTLLGLESFTIRGEIQCSYDSLNSLRQLVSETNNSSEFYFDIRALHWPTYIESYLIGTKRYVLNEDINCLNGAQRHLNNLRNIRWTFNTIILVLLWRIFISKRPTARNLWYFIINFFVAKFVRFFKILSAGNT
jgi:fatty acyl-CoA reductase